jgi:hypothetical protein
MSAEAYFNTLGSAILALVFVAFMLIFLYLVYCEEEKTASKS